MSLDLVQTLSELVAIPSVNPMGRPLSGPEFYEYRVTEYLERLFTRLGLPWVRQQVAPLRENIVARLDGDPPAEAGGRVLLLEAHQDTVPVDGMTIAPWTPEIRQGRLYGRGACDIKGGMTAMLAVLARLVEERPAGRPTVIMGCTVNEEHGFSGALELTRLWREDRSGFLPRRPDEAVVAEPTSLDVVVAHKGSVRWRCHTRGRSAHSSQPQRGDNAIYRMSRVLQALERYAEEVAPTRGEHPLCGRATLSVGTISGGLSVNTVPERCTIEIDRRLLPGESGEAAYRHVMDYVREQTGGDMQVEHERPFLEGAALSDGPNAALAERLALCSRAAGGSGRTIGVSFGTDAATLAAYGVPTVVFGPGSIDQAHTADEWLPLVELEQAAAALYALARGGG